MKKKSVQRAKIRSLISNDVSGQLTGVVYQKNGILRLNNRVLIKRKRKKGGV